MGLENFPEPVHHFLFMVDERMRVTVESYGGVFVPEQFGKRFHVHSALDRAGRERMPKRVEAPPLDPEVALQNFKTALVRSYGNGLALIRFDYERGFACFFCAL